MKNRIVIAAVASLIWLAAGCLEEHVKTTINTDGSSTRTITMKTQSKTIPERAFPVCGDGWSSEWRESGDSSLPYEYAATKSFATPEELRNEYSTADPSRAMRIEVSIEKRFRWFFTYLDYSEIFLYQNPYRRVPVTEYLTPSEIRAYQYNENADSLQSKVELWLMRDMFEDGYAMLMDAAGKLNDPQLSVAFLRENKERCFAALVEQDKSNKRGKESDEERASDTTTSISSEEVIKETLSSVLGKDVVEKLSAPIHEIDRVLTGKDESTKFPDTWEYSTVMSGMLLETNSKEVQGNMVTWKFKPDQAKVANYEMRASSRVVNTWAFVLTGVLVVLLVAVLLIAALRRGKR